MTAVFAQRIELPRPRRARGSTNTTKSYAERLFAFPKIGALEQKAAELAIRGPIVEEEEEIELDALRLIVEKTEGYPYFLIGTGR